MEKHNNYEVGDIVNVRSDLVIDEDYQGWGYVNDMAELVAWKKTFEVERVSFDKDIPVYRLKGGNGWGWTEAMFEPKPHEVDLEAFNAFLLGGDL